VIEDYFKIPVCVSGRATRPKSNVVRFELDKNGVFVLALSRGMVLVFLPG
jgi:hypothetical protein